MQRPSKTQRLRSVPRKSTGIRGRFRLKWRGVGMVENTSSRGTWMMGATILVALLALAPPAAAQPLRPRIVNGIVTGDFPTTGALLFGPDALSARTVCSGTMIGCETFLTAAHCVCDSDGADCTGPNPPDPAGLFVYLQHAGFFTVTSIALRSDYDFPVADVAVLKLSSAMTGIRPTPLDTTGAGSGVSGAIAGFGRTGGSNNDYGIKRSGEIVTATCSDPVSDTTSICWSFTSPLGPPGTNSNTCNGDSGGPLFIDYGAGPVLAGVTSGGVTANCLPTDDSYDTRVSFYASWIQGEGGADLNNTTCGSGPQVGDSATSVHAYTGQLNSATTQATHTIEVLPGTTSLRVALNGTDQTSIDFDLYVKEGAPPTTGDYDCAAVDNGQYGYCEHNAPNPGTWYVRVDRFSGTGTYQATVTLFGTDCSQPGQEGNPCDDENQCTTNDVCQSGSCVGTTVSNGTACDDGEQCTTESCQSGACTAIPLTGDPCDDGSACTQLDTCQAGTCTSGTAPAPACKQSLIAGKSSLLIKDKLSGKDKLVWRWTRGQSTALADFADPVTTTDYALCVYDESSVTPQLVMERIVPAGSGWAPNSKGFKYKDAAGTSAGFTKVILKSGDDLAAKIIVKGKGDGLGLSAVPVDQLSSVRVQLLTEDQCWEAHYTSLANDTGTFKAKSD